MRRIRSLRIQAHHRRDQRGVTMVEMTITVALISLLVGTALTLMTVTQSRVRHITRETESLDGARTTMGRLSKEVRDGVKIYEDVDCPIATCLTLAVQDSVSGVVGDVRYRYDAALKTLYRSVGTRSLLTGLYEIAGVESPAVTNLVNGSGTAVFCREAPCTAPSEKAVEIVLIVNAQPTRPSEKITLRTYVTPRNQT